MTKGLQGIEVVELSTGGAGSISTMLLAESGASIVRIVKPGADLSRITSAPRWDQNKTLVTADLRESEGFDRVVDLLQNADVLVDAFAPGTMEDLGLGPAVIAGFPRLVHCSISGYGGVGARRLRPGYDCLVQARTGMMYEQPGHRDGPIFHWAPLPSYGAGLLAACGITAALREREVSGLGQAVGTSMLQGVLAWTSMPWVRVERPPRGFYDTYACRDVSPTPNYQAGDGAWLHPMPDAISVMLPYLGMEASELAGSQNGSCSERKLWQAAVQEMFSRKPADEWLELFWKHDIRCQPVISVAESHDHPQVQAVGAVRDTTVGGSRVREFGRAFTATSLPGLKTTERAPTGRHLASPLEGIRVLDFGLALAGPYGAMLLSDLGADVIRVDSVNAPRATDNQVWAACQRGKRSITLDLKSPDGQEVVARLLRQADVVHHNMRPGVAERLGIGYEGVRAVNPSIVYCHVTGFGVVGPLAAFPGSDQMSQALSGLEDEQGATAAGGNPTWNRLGMCDHATAILSVFGVLQALHRREQTGDSALIEASITGAAAFLTSHVSLSEHQLRFPGLDRAQTGLGPLYRLYETIDGWICVAVIKPGHWTALCEALELGILLDDPRYADGVGREENVQTLERELTARFATRSSSEWLGVLDAADVPAEIAAPDFIDSWFDDPSVVSQGWVTKYEHPIWGRTEQLGRLWDFAQSPSRCASPPVVHGQHSKAILSELGYSATEIEKLAQARVTTVWRESEQNSN